MPPHLAIVGSVNFDLVVRAPRIVKEGENLPVSNLQTFAGGKGANRAVAAQRLGAKATLIGAVGADTFGGYLQDELAKDGVGLTYLARKDGCATGMAWITLFPSGNNAIMAERGANRALSPADVERARPALQSCDAVVVDLEIPLETVECALMTARRLGKPAILDAGPAQTCPMKILAGADIVSPNESELETLSGMPVDGLASAKAAARHLIDQHIPAMVLKLGDKGSLWITNSEEIYAPAVKVEAIDPTAAGDAFTTALAIKWVLRTPIAEALRYANVVGALTTTKMGAMPSLPTQEEVAAFYRENDSLESARQIR